MKLATNSRFGSTTGEALQATEMGAKVSQMRSNLEQRFAGETSAFVPGSIVRRALSDAEALAWTTPYPLLVLPVLAEEKVTHARQWVERQADIRERQKAALSGQVFITTTE